jgi:hypothetical protein
LCDGREKRGCISSSEGLGLRYGLVRSVEFLQIVVRQALNHSALDFGITAGQCRWQRPVEKLETLRVGAAHHQHAALEDPKTGGPFRLALEAFESVFRISLSAVQLSVANLVANPQGNIFRGGGRLAARREDDDSNRPQQRRAQALTRQEVREGLGNFPQKILQGRMHET